MKKLLTEREIADLLNMSMRTLQEYRFRGIGPRFIKIGRAVRYSPEDVEAYIAARRRASTPRTGMARVMA